MAKRAPDIKPLSGASWPGPQGLCASPQHQGGFDPWPGNFCSASPAGPIPCHPQVVEPSRTCTCCPSTGTFLLVRSREEQLSGMGPHLSRRQPVHSLKVKSLSHLLQSSKDNLWWKISSIHKNRRGQISFFFFSFFFKDLAGGIWKFPGWGLEQSYSCGNSPNVLGSPFIAVLQPLPHWIIWSYPKCQIILTINTAVYISKQ